MSATALPVTPALVSQLQARFLAILPRIELHARIVFRHLKCPHAKADAIAEVTGLAWRSFLRLAEQGKDASAFVTTFAEFAVRAVRSGRRLAGVERVNDVLSPVAQRRRCFAVSPLPDGSSLSGNVFEEALQDNTQTPIPEQVAFRFDFPAWLSTRTERDRQIIDDMARNEPTGALARKFGVSPGRISQLRRQYHDDWQRFHGEFPLPESILGTPFESPLLSEP